jgi:hypothetical protein
MFCRGEDLTFVAAFIGKLQDAATLQLIKGGDLMMQGRPLWRAFLDLRGMRASLANSKQWRPQ